MQQRAFLLILALLTLLVTAGCGRARGQTDIRADGSFTRIVTYAMGKDMAGGQGPKMEDLFGIPEGEGWKVERAETDRELTLTATREFPVNSVTSGDLIVKGKKGPLIENRLTVQRVGNRLVYTETLRWLGPKPAELDRADDQLLAELRKALPEGNATPEDANAVGQKVFREIWKLMFGPGDPLLGQVMVHPDLFERRLRQRLGTSIDSALKERFGDRLNEAQRAEVARKLLSGPDVAKGILQPEQQAQQAQDPENEGSQGLIALTIVAKFPGRIVESNGEIDPISGEVFWAMYPEAALLGEVTLKAICELP